MPVAGYDAKSDKVFGGRRSEAFDNDLPSVIAEVTRTEGGPMNEDEIIRIIGIAPPEGRYPPSMLLDYYQSRREHFLKRVAGYPCGITQLSLKQFVCISFLVVYEEIERHGDRLNAFLGFKAYEDCWRGALLQPSFHDDVFLIARAAVYKMFQDHMQQWFEAE